MGLGLGLLGSLGADEVSLVRVGESWRYFRGVGEPSEPATAWRGLAFDDSSWAAGMSGFSLIGDEATPVRGPGSFSSVYFRRRFNLADPASVQWLVLRLDYASGFVAYLNGHEVLRQGLDGDPPPHDAYASSSHARGTAIDFDVSGYTSLLIPGDNLLAIQAHVAASSPSALTLVPELLANFQRGPFVGNASADSIQVVWRTPAAADSVVEFGPDPSLAWIISDETAVGEHAVTLSGLEPDTRYYYRVRSSAGEAAAESPVYSFRTLKKSGSLSFAVLGDSGGGYAAQFRVAQVLAEANPDLVLHAGDLIYGYFTLGYSDTRLLSVYGAHMRSTPYYFTFGNHELYGGSDRPYLDTLYLPTNSASGTEHYYSFDHGDAHFVCLFLPTLTAFPGVEEYELAVGSTQYVWLTNDLAQTAKPWKLVFMHSPLVTSSAHRRDDLNLNGIPDRLEIQQILLPVFQQYGVQAVFSGHDHNYERIRPTNGVHAFVTGGGGYSLYDLTERDPLSVQFWKTYNCLKVMVSGDTMQVEALDQYGNVLDTASIQKAPPPRRTWRSAWHVTTVEDGPATDGDGNITVQTFNLVGAPIPARSGDFSNLGEIYVNNDPAYLYLGFKQAMIGADQNIFLFIESPRLAGVSRLAGLGNGILDPEGEGADGLDFLKNLSFTNFAPSLACLLGDEFADGQYRSFDRPALALNVGQGVFRLDAGFSDVAGARLQQFDISPQAFYPGVHQGASAERNADLIEVAIPYQALGGLQPGDQVRIGAVVGGGLFDPATQSRQLDYGFLGSALHGSGLGPVVLEGLTVQLADYPPNADSDGDGLLDRWEVAHHLDPLSAAGDDGAMGDPDADGFTNLEEQAAGTDPWDRNSVLRTALVVLEPDHLRVTWQAVPGRPYMLQSSTDVAGPFADLLDPFFPHRALSTNESYDVDISAMTSKPGTLFFRVRVLR
jgi:hypothetical protein